MAFIDIIEPEQAEGKLKEIYDDLEKKRGKLAEIHKIQSLNPESIVSHMDLYISLMFGKSPLKRAQREMLGVVVSATNRCRYCQMHHGEALNHYWKDRDRVELLKRDFNALDLTDEDQMLCGLAVQLTEHPGEMKEEHVTPLKEAGFGERAILDAVLIISYFNFVNRIVMGLGVETDEEEMKGYKY